MIICFGKGCSFCLLRFSHEGLLISMCVSFPLGFESGMWNLIE